MWERNRSIHFNYINLIFSHWRETFNYSSCIYRLLSLNESNLKLHWLSCFCSFIICKNNFSLRLILAIISLTYVFQYYILLFFECFKHTYFQLKLLVSSVTYRRLNFVDLNLKDVQHKNWFFWPVLVKTCQQLNICYVIEERALFVFFSAINKTRLFN